MIRNHIPASQVIQMLREGARAAVNAVSDLAVQELKEMTGTQGPPRSLPWEPPAMETQAMNESIRKQLYSDRDAEGAAIGEDTPYSLAIEFGYAPNNLAPRPHQSVEFNKLQTDQRYTDLAAQKARDAMRAGS